MAQISAVTLVVPDHDAAIAFYVGVMGFRLTADVDRAQSGGSRCSRRVAGRNWCWRGQRGQSSTRPLVHKRGGRVFLFLKTDDFARDHARMTAAGVAFEEAPRVESYGTVAVWRDPFGNRWDLIGPPPDRLV